MNKIKPFENDSQSISVGPDAGITIENGTEEIVVYGDITINKNTSPEDIQNIIDVLNEIKNNLNPQIEKQITKKL